MGRIATPCCDPARLFLRRRLSRLLVRGDEALDELDGKAGRFVVIGIEALPDRDVSAIGGLMRARGLVSRGVKFLYEVFAFLPPLRDVAVSVHAQEGRRSSADVLRGPR